MKRLTKAQSELIEAFLAEHAARVSTAEIEKDCIITEVFSTVTEPVLYQGNAAKFILCGGTAVSKAHRITERISEDVDLRVILPQGLSGSAHKRMLSHIKAEVLERLRKQGYDIPNEAVKAGDPNSYIAILLSYESLYPPDQALRPELLIEIKCTFLDPRAGSLRLRHGRQRNTWASAANRRDRLPGYPRSNRWQERRLTASMVSAAPRRRPGV